MNGQEISHVVLSQGKPVLAAGQAEIAGSKALGYFGLDISTHSGHYMNGASTELNATVMSRARDAFSAMGINF